MTVVALILPLQKKIPVVIGAGAFLKNTLCLIQDNEAYISRDNGSLDNVTAIENYERTANELIKSAHEKPVAIAHDLHPDFHSTHYALNTGIPSIAVQHHHAHIAAVMAEYGVTEPVLGLALDGFGLGHNNESWGGELLRVSTSGFDRIGHLFPLPQPGGDLAARQTWRMGAAALWAVGRGKEIAEKYKSFSNSAILETMLERGINCPVTSSAGRLFDAACGILGVKPLADFEGEAPMALEALVKEPKTDINGWKMAEANGISVLDMRPLLERLIPFNTYEGAELFHGTLIAALSEWIENAAEKTGIKTVAFGGGCFFNKVLRDGLSRRMMDLKLVSLFPKQLSFGDAALSLGQAWVVAMSAENGRL